VRLGALLAAAALAVACSTETPQSCPGEAVAEFTFGGAATTAAALAELDPDPALTDCPAALGFPPVLRSFGGTLAADDASSASSAGALCRSRGPHLFGTRTGRRFRVETSSAGAVLAACGPTCATTLQIVISGDVLPELAAPQEFRGALVERLSAGDGCDACTLPCAARYALTGTVGPP
jgi:hypothetical protein